MLTTRCYCGNPKNPNAKQCMACANESRRNALLGRQHDESRRIANSEGQRRRTDDKRFNLAEHMAARPHPFAKPVGTTRIANGHTQIKCEDGKWRYRARVVWAAANGSIPAGRLIHHRNENPHDDRLENLQMVTRAEHAVIHATPEKQRAAQLLGVAARKRNGTY